MSSVIIDDTLLDNIESVLRIMHGTISGKLTMLLVDEVRRLREENTELRKPKVEYHV